MELSEFEVGKTFKCGGRTWLCTDLGRRTIVAICIGPASRKNDWFRSLSQEMRDAYHERETGKEAIIDPSWFKGPPYALEEHVFDEYDQKGCTP